MDKPTLTDIKGVGKAAAERLADAGLNSIDDVANADPAKLAAIEGFSGDRAESVIAAAKELNGEDALPISAKPEVTQMTNDDKQTTDVKAEDTADAKPAAKKTAAKKAAPKKKAAAKKAAPKKKAAAKKAAPKKAAEKKTDAASAAAATATVAASKSEPAKAESKPAEPKKVEAKPAQPTPAPTPSPSPSPAAHAPKRPFYKEPGAIAAGVILVLAAYGFASQPNVQKYLGLEEDSLSVSSMTSALGLSSDPAVETGQVATKDAKTETASTAKAPTSASATPKTSTNTSSPFTPPMMGQGMGHGAMGPNGMGQGMGPGSMAQGMHPGMGPGMQQGMHPGMAQGMRGPMMPTPPAHPITTDEDAESAEQTAPNTVPVAPFGPYNSSTFNANNSGYGNGAGNMDSAFKMHMSGRSNTNAYGYGNNRYNGYNAYGPYGYAPYGYAPQAPYAPVPPQHAMPNVQR